MFCDEGNCHVRILLYRIPDRDSNSPDDLTGNGPVVHFIQPLEHAFFVAGGVEFDFVVFDGFDDRLFEVFDFDEPVGDDHGFEGAFAFIASSHSMGVFLINFN